MQGLIYPRVAFDYLSGRVAAVDRARIEGERTRWLDYLTSD
jgi:hypothetical protein